MDSPATDSRKTDGIQGSTWVNIATNLHEKKPPRLQLQSQGLAVLADYIRQRQPADGAQRAPVPPIDVNLAISATVSNTQRTLVSLEQGRRRGRRESVDMVTVCMVEYLRLT